MFNNTKDYYTDIDNLKERLKKKVTDAFCDIYVSCIYGDYNIWGNVISSSKNEFMEFTKGCKELWCNKICSNFENGFYSVLKTIHVVYKDINIETLLFFIDDFFTRQDLFEEKWFTCSECHKEKDFLDDDSALCFECHPFTRTIF